MAPPPPFQIYHSLRQMDTHQILHLLHLLVLGPLLIGVGLRSTWLPLSPTALIALGVGIALYHAWKLLANPMRWINWLHIAAVAPALIIAGALPDARWPRELLLMLGIAAVGYHGYYLVSA